MTGFTLVTICLAALLIVLLWRWLAIALLLCVGGVAVLLGFIFIFVSFVFGAAIAVILRLAARIIQSRERRA